MLCQNPGKITANTNIEMSNKPVSEYYAHKYPNEQVSDRTIQGLLTHINRCLSRIHQLEADSVKMRAELDSMAEYLCDTSLCKRRYQGVMRR